VKKLVRTGLIVVLTAAAPAMATHGGERDRGLNERQHRLEQRIEQGWRSGELTPREYRRLRDAVHGIDRTERVFWSDGYLSPRERSALHARLDRLSREIYREKQDIERRHGTYNYDYHDQRANRRF